MAAPTQDNDSVLMASGVTIEFGGFKAIDNVTLTISLGAVHGLIGPNGAGKTTMVNVLTGFQSLTSGNIILGQEDMISLPAHAIRRAGIARTFQAGRLFLGLDVLDNLAVVGVGLGYSRSASESEAKRVLKWMGIGHLADLKTAGLPYIDIRRVGIARAIMFTPKYLLLDEPAAGMSEMEADDLATIIHRIADELGCGVLLIEHNVGLVLKVSHHVYVLDAGKIIEEGDRDTILSSKIVREAYLGVDQEEI